MKSHLMSLVLLFCAASSSAANFVVGVGETKSIDADATYDEILVNGTLSIAAGVTVNAKRFVVASNDNANVAHVYGSCTIGEGATLLLPTDLKVYGYVGIGPFASATLVLEKNAKLSGGRFVMGTSLVGNFSSISNNYNNLVPNARNDYGEKSFDFHNFIHLKEGACLTGTITDSTFKLGNSSDGAVTVAGSKDNPSNRIRLDKDAYLDFASVQCGAPMIAAIEFNGGSIRQSYFANSVGAILKAAVSYWYTKPGATSASLASKPASYVACYLKSIDGNDIVIDKRYYGTPWFDTYFMGKFLFTGSGDLVLKGNQSWAGKLCYGNGLLGNFVYNNGYSAGGTDFKSSTDFTGNIRVEEYVALQAESLFIYAQTKPNNSQKKTITFKDNAKLNLAGVGIKPQKTVTFMDNATVTNAIVLSKNILGPGNLCTITNAVSSSFNICAPTVSMRVQGNSTLTLGEKTTVVSNLIVTAGSKVVGESASLAVKELDLDSTADVTFAGAFAPSANGILRLTGYTEPFATPLSLPLTATGIVGKENLKSWTLFSDGVMKGTVGAADPVISFYKGTLTLGLHGMMLIMR